MLALMCFVFCQAASDVKADEPQERVVLSEYEVKLVDAGEGKRVLLELNLGNKTEIRFESLVGGTQSATVNKVPGPAPNFLPTRFDLRVVAGPTSRVGSSTPFELRVESFEIDAEGEIDTLDRMAVDMLRLTFQALARHSYGWDQSPTGLVFSESTSEAFREGDLAGAGVLPIVMFAPPYPSEPVGVGARWTANGRTLFWPIKPPADEALKAEYELTALAPGQATVRFRMSGRAQNLALDSSTSYAGLTGVSGKSVDDHSGTLEGTLLIELESGLIREATFHASELSSIQVAMFGNDLSMEIGSELDVKVTRRPN